MPKGPGPKHSACRPGERVRVKLRDGSFIIDRFIERRNGVVYLQAHGAIAKADIASFAVIQKGRRHT